MIKKNIVSCLRIELQELDALLNFRRGKRRLSVDLAIGRRLAPTLRVRKVFRTNAFERHLGQE